MATALDLALGPVAANMINQFGTTVTLRGGEVTTYNAETGVATKSTQEEERKVIINSATTMQGAGAKTTSKGVKPNASNSSFDKSGLTLVFARQGESFPPATGYNVIFGDEQYTIQSVTPEYSGDEIAVYSVVVSL